MLHIAYNNTPCRLTWILESVHDGDLQGWQPIAENAYGLCTYNTFDNTDLLHALANCWRNGHTDTVLTSTRLQ